MEKRFPSSEVLDAFQLFDCSKAKARSINLEYGEEELQVLYWHQKHDVGSHL